MINISLNSGKKFDIVLMNPPYADDYTGGMYLDMQFVEKANNISKLSVVVHPLSRWISDTTLGRKNAEGGHLKNLEVVDAKLFGVNSYKKYVGIYTYDNINEYTEVVVMFNDEQQRIGLDYSERKQCYTDIMFDNPQIVKIIQHTTNTYNDLKDKYNTMVNDGHGFIYEENRLRRGRKKYGVEKDDQQSLSRVKEYLKSGKYKYCLYKGSFNNEYDEVQEWDGQDPDKLFRGQICWLMNSKRVKNNMKYWMECPLFDLWRRYKFIKHIKGKGVSGCAYGEIPALDFEQPESDFRKYVDSLNDFTVDEIEELKKFKVHNADKLTND